MKTKFSAVCFVVAALLAPVAAHAADGDMDRSHPVTYVKDSAITVKVKAKLADEKISTLAHISVDTDNKGIVYLSGKVASQAEADKAVSIARATEGVASVKSELTVGKND